MAGLLRPGSAEDIPAEGNNTNYELQGTKTVALSSVPAGGSRSKLDRPCLGDRMELMTEGVFRTL